MSHKSEEKPFICSSFYTFLVETEVNCVGQLLMPLRQLMVDARLQRNHRTGVVALNFLFGYLGRSYLTIQKQINDQVKANNLSWAMIKQFLHAY